MSLKLYLKGLLTFVGGTTNRMERRSARYFYSVWMRHFVRAKQLGFVNHNAIVAELGPGTALGAGIAALLTGASCYKAFDVVRYSDPEYNLEMFDSLIDFYNVVFFRFF